jgi:endonuclease V-like protein UPF0215 family
VTVTREPLEELIRRVEEVRLRTGHTVYVRRVGVSRRATEVMLNSLTVSGKVPEPLRLAKLVARAARAFLCS